MTDSPAVAASHAPQLPADPTDFTDAAPRAPGAHTRLGPLAWLVKWFLNPYVQLAVGAILVTVSELLMKKGASDPGDGSVGWLGIAALASAWTWAGIVTYILSFLSWIYVLRFVPLAIAYALINVAHVLIPLGAWLFLHEPVSLRRWAGIALVVFGILLLLKSVVKVESREGTESAKGLEGKR